MKKILITGVFASGKTSLIDLLKTTLEGQGKQVSVIGEVARKCPFNLNQKQNLMSTSWLVMAQIKNEITISEDSVDYIIFDRGLPDIIAHTEYILKEGSDELYYFRMLEGLGKASINNYDHIFLSMRSDAFNIHVDEIRVDNVKYQEELENLHVNYLDRTKVNYITLKEKNSDRLIQILEEII